eukprot:scaffold624058_cov19-Prasinocladus_malaysianus.AAC.1
MELKGRLLDAWNHHTSANHIGWHAMQAGRMVTSYLSQLFNKSAAMLTKRWWNKHSAQKAGSRIGRDGPGNSMGAIEQRTTTTT